MRGRKTLHRNVADVGYSFYYHFTCINQLVTLANNCYFILTWNVLPALWVTPTWWDSQFWALLTTTDAFAWHREKGRQWNSAGDSTVQRPVTYGKKQLSKSWTGKPWRDLFAILRPLRLPYVHRSLQHHLADSEFKRFEKIDGNITNFIWSKPAYFSREEFENRPRNSINA